MSDTIEGTAHPRASGKLALNIMHFGRALRDAGLPIGPGAVLDALSAAELAGFGVRGDFRAALHAIFVKKREHSIVFEQAFDLFWRRRGFLDKLMAALSPTAEPKNPKKNRAEAGATRVSDALNKPRPENRPAPAPELSARLTVSADERLAEKDFAQMSAAEIEVARRLVAKLVLPANTVKVRRQTIDPRGSRIDPRRSFRRSLRAGGAVIDLARRSPERKHPPIVTICDISGSMADYTRIFLHFLHALTARRRAVHSFLFGTRLTNVTRALRTKDPDAALALCGTGVLDWAGGTRIGPSLHRFNKDWSRRVLSGGAIVILFTDGLEREGIGELDREMDRLHRSCRRLIWVNPLLRFAEFEAKAGGIRAILPHVDEFRPIHNLRSMEEPRCGLERDRALRGGPAALARCRGLRIGPCCQTTTIFLAQAERWRREGKGVAIATVVETWGSAPRPVGSHLVIDADGRFLGSVSGGCVEGEVVTEALDVIDAGAPRMLEFGVADETAWRVGLSCGGRIKVLVERVD